MSNFRFFRDHPALGFTAVTIIAFFVVMLVFPADDGRPTRWLSEVLRQYSLVASGDQRKAHLMAVALTAAFSILAFAMARHRPLMQTQLRWPEFNLPIAGALVVIGLTGYAFGLPRWLTFYACIVATGPLLLIVAATYINVNLANAVITCLIGAYVAILIVPGFIARPIVLMEGSPVALSQFEQHLLLLTTAGPALSAGQNYFGDLPYSYGLIFPSIMSLFDRRFGGLSLGDQLQFVQISQFIFCAAAVAAYFTYRPNNRFGILIAILLAGPYWTTAGLGIWHPNQTGFRSDAFPVGLLVLAVCVSMRPGRLSWILGAAAGIALLSNLETAISLCVGYAVFLILRTRQISVFLYLKCAAAGVATIAVYLLGYRLALRRFPFAPNPTELYAYLERFLGGGIGLRLFSPGDFNVHYFIVPFAIVMFAHAIYVVIDGFRAVAAGPLSPRRAFRVAVASTLIVWMSYYFGSPNWWQIWTHFFLYGFLLIDVFDLRYFGFGSKPQPLIWRRVIESRIAIPRLAVVFLLALLIPHTTYHMRLYTQNFVFPTWLRSPHEAVVVSDVMVPKVLGDALLTKARKLIALHAEAKGRLTYLTFNMAFMPTLTRIFEPTPYRDLWVDTPGDQAFDGIMTRLMEQHPSVILIDDPASPLAIDGQRKEFQDRVRNAVATAYQLRETTDGWQIWRPK